MAFEENLNIEIESLFDAKGFKQLRASIQKARAEMEMLNQAFGQADRLRNMRGEAAKMTDEIENMGRVLDEAGLEESPLNNVIAQDARSGQPIKNAEAIERIADAKERLDQGRGGAGGIFGDQIRMTGRGGGGALQEARNMPTPDIQQFGRFRGMLMSVAATTGILNMEMLNLNRATQVASQGFTSLKRHALSAAGSLASTSVNARQLQMRLLGLQFQLLSLAFIFGGLMGSALGAVGVFEILGNTLRMFFLPAALEILPIALDIQDALLGVDEETRRLIGRVFAVIAAISALGSILAFVLNGFVAVGSVISSVVINPIARLITWLAGTQTVTAALGQAWSWLVGVAGGVGMAIASIASFLAGAAAAFTVVIAVAERWGKKVALVVGTILAAIGAVVAFFVSIPAVMAAAIGVAVGAILGLIWTFRDEIIGAITGLIGWLVGAGAKIVDALLWPFQKLYDLIVGNSIIPDLVRDVISWLKKLPGEAYNFATGMIDNIIKGIKGAGNKIWEAFKSVLPDFLVDALEGVGSTVGGAVDAAGNLVGGVTDAAGNFASGVGGAVGGVFGGGENQGGGANVQNNSINANVNIQDSRETPEETGRKFGQGLSQGLNNQTSNISNGT